MNCECIKPSVSTCALRIYDNKEIHKKEYISDWHIHSEYEIILLYSGSKQVYIDNKIITLTKGDVIFINSNIPHKTVTPVDSSCMLLQFTASTDRQTDIDFDLIGLLKTNETSYELFKHNRDITLSIKDCMEKIGREYNKKEKTFEYFIKAYLYELTAVLYRNGILTDYDERLEKTQSLNAVLKYINTHYNEHISLSEISKVANLHSSYFCKVFKNTIGTSFVEYLNLVRLNEAKQLLKTTQKNITEISYETGFSSVSYFIKTFKRYNYCSPNKFKAILSANKKDTFNS